MNEGCCDSSKLIFYRGVCANSMYRTEDEPHVYAFDYYECENCHKIFEGRKR